jgi:phosphatidylserine/phosphatidylglycerophosphate/cardiolipin synthase-like enzyme
LEPLTELGQALLQKNRADGVNVRILLNDVIGIQVFADSVKEVRDYLTDEQNQAAHTVEVRGFPRHFNGPLHAKIAIIDGRKAYVLGSPFIQGYYDGETHKVDEPRRGECSFWEHTDCSPLHEVSVSLEGPAVEALNDTFLLLWNRVGSAVGPTKPTPPATTNAAVQIVRTVPANLFGAIPKGETGVLEAYLHAIREPPGLSTWTTSTSPSPR